MGFPGVISDGYENLENKQNSKGNNWTIQERVTCINLTLEISKFRKVNNPFTSMKQTFSFLNYLQRLVYFLQVRVAGLQDIK